MKNGMGFLCFVFQIATVCEKVRMSPVFSKIYSNRNGGFMQKKYICVLFLLIVLLISFCSCRGNTNNGLVKNDVNISSSAQSIGEGKNKFTFIVADADGTQTVFYISTNKKFVGEALKEYKLIDGEEGQFGLYVKTVNSLTYDYDKDGKYWAFYVNDEYALSGVDKTEIKKGDSYMFKAE